MHRQSELPELFYRSKFGSSPNNRLIAGTYNRRKTLTLYLQPPSSPRENRRTTANRIEEATADGKRKRFWALSVN